MLPEPVFRILGLRVYVYDIAYMGGFILALALALVLARERKLALRPVLEAWLVCVVASLGLARLLVVMLKQFDPVIPIQWSLAQIIAVLVALGIYAALKRGGVDLRESLNRTTDVAAAPIALYVVIARLGCLAAGCCYGKIAENLAWAVTFSNPLAATPYKNIPIHPTQMYEAAGAFAILALILALRRHAAWGGRLLWVFILTYALLRFVIEFFRGDPRPMVGIFSLNQIICMGFIAIGIFVFTRSVDRTAKQLIPQNP